MSFLPSEGAVGAASKDTALECMPYDIGLGGMGEGVYSIQRAYEDGTEEIRMLLERECSFLYECKACLEIFRGAQIFAEHKLNVCKLRHREDVVAEAMEEEEEVVEEGDEPGPSTRSMTKKEDEEISPKRKPRQFVPAGESRELQKIMRIAEEDGLDDTFDALPPYVPPVKVPTPEEIAAKEEQERKRIESEEEDRRIAEYNIQAKAKDMRNRRLRAAAAAKRKAKMPAILRELVAAAKARKAAKADGSHVPVLLDTLSPKQEVEDKEDEMISRFEQREQVRAAIRAKEAEEREREMSRAPAMLRYVKIEDDEEEEEEGEEENEEDEEVPENDETTSGMHVDEEEEEEAEYDDTEDEDEEKEGEEIEDEGEREENEEADEEDEEEEGEEGRSEEGNEEEGEKGNEGDDEDEDYSKDGDQEDEEEEEDEEEKEEEEEEKEEEKKTKEDSEEDRRKKEEARAARKKKKAEEEERKKEESLSLTLEKRQRKRPAWMDQEEVYQVPMRKKANEAAVTTTTKKPIKTEITKKDPLQRKADIVLPATPTKKMEVDAPTCSNQPSTSTATHEKRMMTVCYTPRAGQEYLEKISEVTQKSSSKRKQNLSLFSKDTEEITILDPNDPKNFKKRSDVNNLPVYLSDKQEKAFFGGLREIDKSTNEKGDPYQCSYCQATLPNKNDGRRHMVSHIRVMRLRCGLCGAGAFFGIDMRNHLMNRGCPELHKAPRHMIKNGQPCMTKQSAEDLTLVAHSGKPGSTLNTSGKIVSITSIIPYLPDPKIEEKMLEPTRIAPAHLSPKKPRKKEMTPPQPRAKTPPKVEITPKDKNPPKDEEMREEEVPSTSAHTEP